MLLKVFYQQYFHMYLDQFFFLVLLFSYLYDVFRGQRKGALGTNGLIFQLLRSVPLSKKTSQKFRRRHGKGQCQFFITVNSVTTPSHILHFSNQSFISIYPEKMGEPLVFFIFSGVCGKETLAYKRAMEWSVL